MSKYTPMEVQIMAGFVLEAKSSEPARYRAFLDELARRTGITPAEAEQRTHKLARGVPL